MENPPVFAWIAGLLFTVSPLSHGQSYQSLKSAESPQKGIEIAWASDAFATNLMADGATTFSDSHQPILFELGTFKSGFDPTQFAPTEWAANWIVLQTAAYDPIENQVIQTGTLVTNTAPFSQNSQAYIWGYNTKDASAGAEWIVLAAGSWKWPSIDANLPVTFSISDVMKPSEMLMGSVNGIGYHMALQAVIVPEAASLVLFGIAGMGLLARRKR